VHLETKVRLDNRVRPEMMALLGSKESPAMLVRKERKVSRASKACPETLDLLVLLYTAD
jgi:hypothetical protein